MADTDGRRADPERDPAFEPTTRQLERRNKVESILSAALAGVVFAVLAIISLLLLDSYPDLDQGEEELTAWFDEGSNQARLVLGLNLVAISSVAFLWFLAVIRRRVGRHEDQFFGTVYFGSGIAFTVIWLVSGAAVAAPAVATTMLGAGTVSESSASLAGGFAGALILVVAPRLQAVFVLTTSTVILRSRILPSWLAVVGYVMGLGMFFMPIVARAVGIAFPLWVLIVSVVIIFRRAAGDIPAAALPAADGTEPD